MESSAELRATVTQEQQWMLEGQVFHVYQLFANLPPKAQSVMLELQRDKHMEFLAKGLRQLGPSFVVLDANRPWLCYWILHSIALLGEFIDADLEHSVIDFLHRCQDQHGGYGGGPSQMAHLATTYAAVNSLITLGGHRSLFSINRGKVYSFLHRMKQTSGGFRMHDGGEIDVRACYTAISVASILNILDDELVKNVGDYILSCQTYEGGIAGEPGSEAHGGYTFCGLATMILINEVHRLEIASLMDWLLFRQGVEGGFQGRTNKLVDGCYSFWQGATALLIQRLHAVAGEEQCHTGSSKSCTTSDISEGESCFEGTSTPVKEACCSVEEGQHNASDGEKSIEVSPTFIKENRRAVPLFQSIALQQYILLCSQVEGGFRDKPGKSRDHYHTCYCLSGLSVCQYSVSENAEMSPLPSSVWGPYSNILEPINPLYNIIVDRCNEAREFFASSC